MRLLITGSDGFTGSHYCRMGCDQGHEILGTDVKNTFIPEGCRIETLDIRDEKACKDICGSFRPDAIIHTARAPGNLWQTEQERMNTYQINVLGTKALGRCAEDLGAAFIFLSTDWVFSGTRPEGEKYDEEDDGGPLNYYGVTKWIAEQEIRCLKTRWLIIRPAHIYGFHAAVLTTEAVKGPDLLQRTVWAGIGNAVRDRMKIKIPEDIFQTPIYVKRLVETTLELLEKGATGIYHLADRDCVSRYGIAKTVLEAIGLESRLIEKGVAEDFARSQGYPEELFGALPANTCLGVHKIEKEMGARMPTFEEGVAAMIADCR